ncbi:MAG TPA: diguanylate cyclase [Nodosilinea sp.]|nr:diguanylate cyclase [Nodosilinea sp.]
MSPFPHQAASWLSSGEDCLKQGSYAQALVAFEQALRLAQHSANPQAEMLVLQRLGHAHLEQGEPRLSVASIQQALAIALEQHNLHALYDCHRQLAQTYKTMHSFELALQHLEAAEGLRDSPGLRAVPDGSPTRAEGALPGHSRPYVPAPTPSEPAAVLLMFRSIVEQANIGVAVFQEGRLVYGNPQFTQWIGYDYDDLGQLALSDLVQLPPEQDMTALSPSTGPGEGQILHRQGHTCEVEIYATTIDYGDRPALLAFMRDITAARRDEAHLRASEARYRSLIHHVPIGLCRFSTTGQPLDANPALLTMFGFDNVAEFLQASPIQPGSLVVDRRHPLAWGDYLSQADTLKDCELKLLRQDGRNLWVRIVARAISDRDGTIQFYEGAVEDITEIKAAQIALEELAMRDSLTHVYNRRHFIELAGREIARSARSNRPVTLLMLDIDHFKAINDTYGHLSGDQVLRDIALRLNANLRQSDILARYGGEEFILLMPETDQAQAWIGAERLRRVIAATPFTCDGGSLSVTASVGLSCWPASGDAALITALPLINDLIGKADQALYRAKQSGRNQTQAEAWLPSVSSSHTA